MSPSDIAALVAAKAPPHAECRDRTGRDPEQVGPDGPTVVVQCSCNVRLTLTVARAEAEQPVALDPRITPDNVHAAFSSLGRTRKGSDDGS